MPTPGSPASRIAAPGTSPPPSTRSNSGSPELRRWEDSTDTWPIGTAGEVTGADAAFSPGAAASATDPHVWHSGQRPTHLGTVWPHSEQR